MQHGPLVGFATSPSVAYCQDVNSLTCTGDVLLEPSPVSSQGHVTNNTGYLKLRGLPFSATAEDVQCFFQGFELQQVFIMKRNGELYMRSPSHVVWHVAMCFVHVLCNFLRFACYVPTAPSFSPLNARREIDWGVLHSACRCFSDSRCYQSIEQGTYG